MPITFSTHSRIVIGSYLVTSWARFWRYSAPTPIRTRESGDIGEKRSRSSGVLKACSAPLRKIETDDGQVSSSTPISAQRSAISRSEVKRWW